MLDKDYLIEGDMYQYNLRWLIQELLSFKQDLATAIDLKTIKYADPIQWDITTQYPANTVVVDPKSGTAYMSKVPVPAGVELTNTSYWVVVFNYQDIYNRIMDGVAFNDRDQDYATKDLLVNDLVWYAGNLYRVTRAIPTGSKYIPGTNLIKTSIESLLARYYGRDRTAQVSNDTINVSGDYTLNAGDIAETADNITVKTKDLHIDSDNPITYGDPVDANNGFKTIQLKNAAGSVYNVLVDAGTIFSKCVDTVADLSTIKERSIVSTLGFYTVNDGGGANYLVMESDTAVDDITAFTAGNGLKAFLIPYDVTFLSAGGKGDKSDETDRIIAFLKYASDYRIPAIFPEGKEYGFKTVYVPSYAYIVNHGTFYALSNDSSFYNKDSYDSVTPAYSANHDICFKGGLINMRANEISNMTVTPFRMMHGSDITISDVEIKNIPGYHAIELIGCQNVKIRNVRFNNHMPNSDFESIIQIEAPAGEVGQSGAYPFDMTPCNNIIIDGCVFKSDDPQYNINAGIESQQLATSAETYYHENITIKNCLFENILKACIMPYRWKNCAITNNKAVNIGLSFVRRLSSGISIDGGIISNNSAYNLGTTITDVNSSDFAILLSSSNVRIVHNIFDTSTVGVLAVISASTIDFANNITNNMATLTYNMFYLDSAHDIVCNCIGNIIDGTHATTGEKSSLASLPPDNKVFNGIFADNIVTNIMFQYRDAKLTSNTDLLYEGSAYTQEIPLSKPVSSYSGIVIVFKFGTTTYSLNLPLYDDIKDSVSNMFNNDATSVLLLKDSVIVDLSISKITHNHEMFAVTIDGANSKKEGQTPASYIYRVYGIKGNK